MQVRDIKPWTQNMSGPPVVNEPDERAVAFPVYDPETGVLYTRDLLGRYTLVDEDGRVEDVDPFGPVAARLDGVRSA